MGRTKLHLRRVRRAGAIGVAIAVLASSPAFADALSIHAVNPGPGTVTNESGLTVITLQVGEAASVTVLLTKTNDDSKSGCNLQGRNKHVTFSISRSAPGVASVTGNDGASLERAKFTACRGDEPDPEPGSLVTLAIGALAPGESLVTLPYHSHLSTTASVTSADFASSAATFKIRVLGDEVEGRDAPAIANEYLRDRGANADCQENLGTNRNKSNWHGNLISAVAHEFEGQTFTPDEEHIVTDYVESLCTGGSA